MSIKRPNTVEREPFRLVFPHAQLTATTAFKMYKVDAGKRLYVERVSYINPTGLAEHNDNNFKGTVNNATTGQVIATLFNTDANLSPDNGASLAADTFIEGDLTPFLPVTVAAFTAEADNDTCTATAHGLLTGDGPVQLTTNGDLPLGLATSTNYWIIKVDANNFKLAASLADAYEGTAVDITGDTTDTDNVVAVAATLRNAGIPAYQWLTAADILSLVFTETGTATLPAGHVVVEGYLY